MKNLYFARTLTFDIRGETIIAVNNSGPCVITFDPWPALAFTAADGQHTVTQFIEQLASQYENGAPPGLENLILELIQQLVNENVIRLSDTPVSLPHYLAVPRSLQNMEESLENMRADGFLRKP